MWKLGHGQLSVCCNIMCIAMHQDMLFICAHIVECLLPSFCRMFERSSKL